jgi:hypothetical protein
MKSVRQVIVAGAIIVGALGFAGAADAARTGRVTASEIVSTLQAAGYHVVLNKFGTAPLDQCVVTSVRQGQTFERMDSGVPGASKDIVTTITARTVYVNVTC